MRRNHFALAAASLASFASILLAAAPVPVPAQSAAQGGKVLKIVSSLPRTGSANAQTTTMVNGIKMALEEVNKNIDGFEILYEDWDDASPQKANWDPQVEAQNANKAVADKSIVGYIGTFNSGASKISMPVLNKEGLVMVSPANTYPGLTKPGTGERNEPKVYRPSGKINYFRVVPTDDLQGSVAAEWAKELGHDVQWWREGEDPPPNDAPEAAIIEFRWRTAFDAALDRLDAFGFSALDLRSTAPEPRFTVTDEKGHETRATDLVGAAKAVIQAAKERKGVIDIARFKGLGEMNADELRDTTMDKDRRTLLRVRLEDAVAADRMFTVLMGEQVEPRRRFIETHALDVAELDV